MTSFIENGKRFRLSDPTLAPNCAGYLWNSSMMIQMNCKGYAVSQYMDPEPRKYVHSPNLAAQGFLQPEQGYFAHHPGRFFYIRDNESGALFSAPYAPVCKKPDVFAFEPGLSDIRWLIEQDGVRVEMCLSLSERDVLELWSVTVTNISPARKKLAFVPYFPVGNMSWMNMGGHFDPELNAIVCESITAYQRTEQFFENRHLQDISYFAADRAPDHFEVGQEVFEGEGGLHNPVALQEGRDLGGGEALYEIPACIMQWNLELAAGESERFRFLFGPAKDKGVIKERVQRYFGEGFDGALQDYDRYVSSFRSGFEFVSPDDELNHFVNHWLPRQVFYHGDSNRLTTDPQTRNYLQDAMGIIYIKPEKTREAILRSVSQQFASGKVPDGILLGDGATLKYINQVPHTDHAVWLVLTVKAYLDETGDRSVLQETQPWSDSNELSTVYDHIMRAVFFLSEAVDERGLPYIAQGDWCDPMNMVGLKGKGVSGWLAQASSYAMNIWSTICQQECDDQNAQKFSLEASQMNTRINELLWDGNWYARGITDDGALFGVASDEEGRIFLNAQSWAMLCGSADEQKKALMLSAIDKQLDTPFGVMMSGPAYTKMREDIGRVTQKWPGSAENGSVYNHAAAFYAASLYEISEKDRAFDVLKKMLTQATEEDIGTRGQLPVYIPNYYRGAYHQFPRTAGRSSNLFNTGTVAWYFKLVLEQMCGVRGDVDGVIIDPQFPSDWDHCRFTRYIRGAILHVEYARSAAEREITVDGDILKGSILGNLQQGRSYQIIVKG